MFFEIRNISKQNTNPNHSLPPFKTKKQIEEETIVENIPNYFRGYFSNIDSNVERLEKNVKQLIKDLGKDGLKKESLEVASLYKKHIIEFKIKMKNFEKKYRD